MGGDRDTIRKIKGTGSKLDPVHFPFAVIFYHVDMAVGRHDFRFGAAVGEFHPLFQIDFAVVGIFAVWFPNAITPKLETNNIFKAFTANSLEDYELYIFDRSGNMIFQTKDVQEGWDGTYKGHDCKAGSYVYIAKYRREGGERVLSQKGTITLLR